jgi:hypothetical protein
MRSLRHLRSSADAGNFITIKTMTRLNKLYTHLIEPENGSWG